MCCIVEGVHSHIPGFFFLEMKRGEDQRPFLTPGINTTFFSPPSCVPQEDQYGREEGWHDKKLWLFESFFFLVGLVNLLIGRGGGNRRSKKEKTFFLGIDAIRHEYKRNDRLFLFGASEEPLQIGGALQTRGYTWYCINFLFEKKNRIDSCLYACVWGGDNKGGGETFFRREDFLQEPHTTTEILFYSSPHHP